MLSEPGLLWSVLAHAKGLFALLLLLNDLTCCMSYQASSLSSKHCHELPNSSSRVRNMRSHIMAARGSGEHALRHLLAPFARARHPLEGRLQARASACFARLVPMLRSSCALSLLRKHRVKCTALLCGSCRLGSDGLAASADMCQGCLLLCALALRITAKHWLCTSRPLRCTSLSRTHVKLPTAGAQGAGVVCVRQERLDAAFGGPARRGGHRERARPPVALRLQGASPICPSGLCACRPASGWQAGLHVSFCHALFWSCTTA